MEIRRKPFEGVRNIIRFNWHYYAIAFALLLALLLSVSLLPPILQLISILVTILVILFIAISLGVSAYVYDFSGFYNLNWIPFNIKSDESVLNVHAGYDETSHLLKDKFNLKNLVVMDFYNSKQHTELSIKRARKAIPPFPGTFSITTAQLPLNKKSVEKVFSIFAAHEIRKTDERIQFFRELSGVLNNNGHVVVAEHLRDIPNFVAYNIGCYHFLPRGEWIRTFKEAGLNISKELKLTPFVTVFILTKNGNTP